MKQDQQMVSIVVSYQLQLMSMKKESELKTGKKKMQVVRINLKHVFFPFRDKS